MLPGMYIGLDVGGTNLKAARIAPDGSIVERRDYPIAGASAAGLFDQLERAVRELEAEDTLAVGAGLPGIIDRQGQRNRQRDRDQTPRETTSNPDGHGTLLGSKLRG